MPFSSLSIPISPTLPLPGGASTNGLFRTVLLANNVSRTSRETGNVKLAMGEVKGDY